MCVKTHLATPHNNVTNINDVEYKGKKRSKGVEEPEGEEIRLTSS
jgi:hypothetical protein